MACVSVMWVLGCMGAPVATTHHDVMLRRTNSVYEVGGDTPDALRTQVDGSGFDCLGRTGFDACTIWTLSWIWKSSPDGGSCRITELDVSLDIDVKLPRATELGLTHRPKWERYLRNLRTHEEGHAAIALTGAERIATAVRALAGPTCAELDAEVQRTADRILQRTREAEVAMDLRTDHGRTQGSRYP